MQGGAFGSVFLLHGIGPGQFNRTFTNHLKLVMKRGTGSQVLRTEAGARIIHLDDTERLIRAVNKRRFDKRGMGSRQTSCAEESTGRHSLCKARATMLVRFGAA